MKYSTETKQKMSDLKKKFYQEHPEAGQNHSDIMKNMKRKICPKCGLEVHPSHYKRHVEKYCFYVQNPGFNKNS